MKTLIRDSARPSMAAACAPAHDMVVGFLGAQGYALRVPADRPWPAPGRVQVAQVQLVQQESVQKIERAQSQVVQGASQLQAKGINGSTAKAIGMATAPVTTDVDTSGVPPRGRPV
jgi:hypothetical protein